MDVQKEAESFVAWHSISLFRTFFYSLYEVFDKVKNSYKTVFLIKLSFYITKLKIPAKETISFMNFSLMKHRA